MSDENEVRAAWDAIDEKTKETLRAIGIHPSHEGLITSEQLRAIETWQKLSEGDRMNAKSALSRCEQETGDGLFAVARDLLEAFEP